MKTLFLLFISLTCLASEPRFHFQDCVEIIHGFYQGCKGTVQDMEDGVMYGVKAECKGASLYVRVKEKDLKSAKGCT